MDTKLKPGCRLGTNGELHKGPLANLLLFADLSASLGLCGLRTSIFKPEDVTFIMNHPKN